MRNAAIPAGLLALAAASCLSTGVLVESEVRPDGSLLRRVVVTSEDDGEPAAPPAFLRPPAGGYLLLEDRPGRLAWSGSFAPGQPVPAPLDLHSDSLHRSAPVAVAVTTADWGLFRILGFRERFADVVGPDDIRTAIEEAADEFRLAADAALTRLLGPRYPETRLHAELVGRLRGLGRELGLQLWRSLVLEKVETDLLVARLVGVGRRFGLPVAADQVLAALEQGQGSPPWLELRRRLGDWAGERLAFVDPETEGAGRRPAWPDMAALLFDGAFLLALEQELQARHGGEEGLEQWLKETGDRIFGLFGGGAGDLEFTLRVRMPGDLLRSNGFLAEDGVTFVRFPADRIYPYGAGLECLSVVWDPLVLGALPGCRILPGNEAALRWTWLLGDGPESDPDPETVALLKECARARSWGPLERRLEAEPGLAERWRPIRAWLAGEKE